MKRKILTILCVLVGLMFLNAGLNKFFFYLPPPKDMPQDSMNMFAAMMQIRWLMPLIAVGEILGGLLFMIPRTRALGTLILFPIMVGILLTHFTIAPEGLAIPLVMAAIMAWVIYENREKYLQLVSR
jgi:putative oxidoreductase